MCIKGGRRMIMPKSLVISVFTRNRNKVLAQTLMSLYNQTYRDFDILIVDDASNKPVKTDPLMKMITNRFRMEGTKVTLKESNTNNGIAKNRALVQDELKKYDYALDLNDDHYLEPRCIQSMIRTLNEDSVCVVGSATPMFFWKPSERFRFYRNQYLNTLFVEDDKLKISRDVDYIYINNDYEVVKDPIETCHVSQFMYKTKYLHNLETHYSRLGFTEETSLCLRLKKNSDGKKLMFQPDAINWHLQYKTGGIREINKDKREEMLGHDRRLFLNNWKDYIFLHQKDWPQKGEVNKWWEDTTPDKKSLQAKGLI